MTNIEKFDIYSGKILAFLLESFPIATDIDVFADIIKDETAPNKEREFVYHTIKALHEYGFIKYGNYTLGGEMFINVILTLKALEVLKAVPSSIKGDKTIGDRLRDSVKLGKDEAIKESVKLAFSQGYSILAETIKGVI